MSFGQPKRPPYQGNKRPQLQRNAVGGDHQIDPVFEAIISQSDKLMGFNVSGNALPMEMVSFTTPDGQGVVIEAYKALMVLNSTFCVPFDSPAYPEIIKLDTVAERGLYYAAYKSRIFWKHSDEYWHIPGYTRYVVNKHGHVKNAYNGLDIKPNEWGKYALFADMPGVLEQKPPFAGVELRQIQMLAFRPLPSDFVDYGFGNYSHTISYNNEQQVINWVARPEVVVRDGMGNVENGRNLTEFGIKFLNNKMIKEFRQVKESELYFGSVNHGQFTVKLKDDSLVAEIEPVSVVGNSTPANAQPSQMSNLDVPPQQTSQQPVTQTTDPSVMQNTMKFDADINF